MKSPFERRIQRATELIESNSSARDQLTVFYRDLAKFQQSIFAQLDSSDLRCLLPHFRPLISLAWGFAQPLSEFAASNLTNEDTQLEALSKRWEGAPEDLDPRIEFFVHILLEPFAMRLAQRGQIDPHWTDPACPFCGSRPALAVLRGEGDGGKRWLKCSLCSTEWQFRRILCPNCGEEDKEKLPVYLAQEFEHVRVEACDTCKTYLKSVDLTKNGLADPIVDEIVTVPLNIWAEEHGYVKLSPNLMGM